MRQVLHSVEPKTRPQQAESHKAIFGNTCDLNAGQHSQSDAGVNPMDQRIAGAIPASLSFQSRGSGRAFHHAPEVGHCLLTHRQQAILRAVEIGYQRDDNRERQH